MLVSSLTLDPDDGSQVYPYGVSSTSEKIFAADLL